MKREFNRFAFVFFAWIYFAHVVYACNICGGVVASSGLNLLSQYEGNFIGLSYSRANLHSKGLVHGHQDAFDQVSVSGRFAISDRWKVQAELPYHWNHRTIDNDKLRRSGVGDITLLAAYDLSSTLNQDNVNKLFAELAFGLQCPTGKNDGSLFLENLPRGFNPGKSQFGLIANPTIGMHGERSGLFFSPYAQFNVRNEDDYSFGHQLRLTAQYYRRVYRRKDLAIEPSVGVQWEANGRDRFASGKTVDKSGGHLLWQQVQLMVKKGNILCQGIIGLPLVEQLHTSNVDVKPRFQARITWLF